MAAKRILRYVKGTIDVGLQIARSPSMLISGYYVGPYFIDQTCGVTILEQYIYQRILCFMHEQNILKWTIILLENVLHQNS
jgi:hypothetical protein